MLNTIFADEQPVSALDRGLAYGDGLFETIRMAGDQATLRHHHLQRMVADSLRLGIHAEYAELDQAITLAAVRYASVYGYGEWVLKLMLTRGVGGRGYQLPDSVEPNLVVTSSDLPSMPDKSGVIVGRSTFPLVVNPRLAGIKSLNRLDQVMASREFTGEEWELIMPDLEGRPVEGTRSNLLAHFDGEWVTPPADALAVAGVARQFCLNGLRQACENVSERHLTPDFTELPGFRGLYLLNSVFGIVPVRRFGSSNLPVDGTLATICDPLKTLE